MSSNQYLIDGLTRHQLFIQRFGTGAYNRAAPALDAAIAKMQDEIRNLDLTVFQMNRRLDMIQTLQDILAGALDSTQAQLFGEFEGFFASEMDFMGRLLNSAVTVEVASPALTQAFAVAVSRPVVLVSGKTVTTATLTDLYKTFSKKKVEQVAAVVQGGFIAGKTTDEIARDIGTAIGDRTRRQAEALIRTSVNHFGDEARLAVATENADILKGEEWVSTLDGQTTAVCRARDGLIFPLSEGPRSPAHYNCRSLRVPVVKDEYKIPGLDGERTSMNGLVSAQTTYNSWLKKQPVAFQNEVLGPARAKLFRSGGLTMRSFVDDAGRTYTLDELRQLEPLAFEKVAI